MVLQYAAISSIHQSTINNDADIDLIDQFFKKQSNKTSLLLQIVQLNLQLQSLHLQLAITHKKQTSDDFHLLWNQYLALLTLIEQDPDINTADGSTAGNCPPSTSATLFDPPTVTHPDHHHTTIPPPPPSWPKSLKPATPFPGEKSRDFLREDYLYPFHKRISDPTKPRILLSKSRNYLPFGMTRDQIERARDVWWFPNKPPKPHQPWMSS